MRRLRVLTWHIHGSYLYYLTHARQEFFLPVKPGRPGAYCGRPPGSFDWPDNLHELPAEEVRRQPFDCILFQSRENYLDDQYEILSESQRRLPRIYLEHDPPRWDAAECGIETPSNGATCNRTSAKQDRHSAFLVPHSALLQSPTDIRHPVDDPNVLLVHVTHFNQLMWDAGRTPTHVIEHGVKIPAGVRYTGEIERGLVVVNNLARRGRRLGRDIYDRARQQVPLDLVGMNTEEAGGQGEVLPKDLPAFAARYRFFFNPIRYTSLGLAVCEAMMLGMPVIGLATTEMATVIQNGISGYVDTDLSRLLDRMRALLEDPGEARRLGDGARRLALSRFSIERFARDWDEAFRAVTGGSRPLADEKPASPPTTKPPPLSFLRGDTA